MKWSEETKRNIVAEDRCDVCGCSATPSSGFQFATLQAAWSQSCSHGDKSFHLKLCESCFLGTSGYVKHLWRSHHMFEDDYDPNTEARLGWVVEDGQCGKDEQ